MRPPPTGYLDIRFVQLFVLPVLFLISDVYKRQGYTMNSANKFKNGSDYSKYLTNKYKCLTPVSYTHLDVYKRQVQKYLAGEADWDEVTNTCIEQWSDLRKQQNN